MPRIDGDGIRITADEAVRVGKAILERAEIAESFHQISVILGVLIRRAGGPVVISIDEITEFENDEPIICKTPDAERNRIIISLHETAQEAEEFDPAMMPDE